MDYRVYDALQRQDRSWYMVISKLGLINSIWALVLPGAVPVFNVILLMNFFKGIPKELEEAAFIDGAGR